MNKPRGNPGKNRQPDGKWISQGSTRKVYQSLARAVQEALTPEEIETLLRSVYDVAVNPKTADREKIHAASLILNRLVGYPSQTSIQNVLKTEKKMTLDLKALSDQELDNYLSLTHKVLPEGEES